jgi:hypothetical protein
LNFARYLPVLAALLATVAFVGDLFFFPSSTSLVWVASAAIALAAGAYYAEDGFRRPLQFCLLAMVTLWTIASCKPSEFKITGDSTSYLVRYDYTSVRPPVYPWFIRAAVGGVKPERWRQELIKPDERRLARVVAAQTVLYATALAAFFWALCSILPSAFVFVIAAFLLAREYHPAAGMLQTIMSESLAATFTLVLATVFVLSLTGYRRGYPLVAGLLFAALFLTRPAATYGAVLCAAIFTVALVRERTFLNREVFIGAALAVMISIAPSIYVYRNTGLFLIAPNGLSLSAKAWLTATLATQEDVARMPDAESRQYVEIMLEKRPRAYQLVESKEWVDVLPELKWHPPIVFPAGYSNQPAWRYANMNLNQVVSPALMAVRHTNTYLTVDLISKAFWPVVKAHREDLYRIYADSFLHGWNSVTRTTALFSWTAFLLVLFAAVFCNPRLGLPALVLFATHASNVLIVATNDAPIRRYILATDYFVLLAAAISLFALAELVGARLGGRSGQATMP